MKLDWECVRAVMLAAEALPGADDAVAPGTFDNFPEFVVIEHIRLLTEARLIEGFAPGNPMFARRLTWEGHQFIRNLRDRNFFHRISRAAQEREIELSFDVIVSTGAKLVEKLI